MWGTAKQYSVSIPLHVGEGKVGVHGATVEAHHLKTGQVGQCVPLATRAWDVVGCIDGSVGVAALARVFGACACMCGRTTVRSGMMLPV